MGEGQDGVSSPLLWPLVVDKALDILSGNEFDVEGYAGDIVLISASEIWGYIIGQLTEGSKPSVSQYGAEKRF